MTSASCLGTVNLHAREPIQRQSKTAAVQPTIVNARLSAVRGAMRSPCCPTRRSLRARTCGCTANGSKRENSIGEIAADWLIRSQFGLTAQEAVALQQWRSVNPCHKRAFDELMETWRVLLGLRCPKAAAAKGLWRSGRAETASCASIRRLPGSRPNEA